MFGTSAPSFSILYPRGRDAEGLAISPGCFVSFDQPRRTANSVAVPLGFSEKYARACRLRPALLAPPAGWSYKSPGSRPAQLGKRSRSSRCPRLLYDHSRDRPGNRREMTKRSGLACHRRPGEKNGGPQPHTTARGAKASTRPADGADNDFRWLCRFAGGEHLRSVLRRHRHVRGYGPHEHCLGVVAHRSHDVRRCRELDGIWVEHPRLQVHRDRVPHALCVWLTPPLSARSLRAACS